ncbi:MAG: BrnT family toxin [Gemmatimonadaceae bacterium]
MFEWDPRKATANAEKHDVTFDVAATVFADAHGLDGPDLAHSTAEARFLRLGRAIDGRVLIVAYTVRKGNDDAEKIRLISARRASRRERAAYAEQD